MKRTNELHGVPGDQDDGKKINVESIASFENIEAATALLKKAKQRLFDVNHWHDFAGNALARFQITDASGKDINGVVSEGCFFKIDIPGPATEDGDGFDWVRVENISSYESADVECVSIRVRPAANPRSPHGETAHFYSSASTSTFTVARENTKVTASVYDHNIKPNNDTDGLLDQVRNFVVGIVGKNIGSKIQWKALTDGLLDQL